ncbi:MAG: phosphoribosylaminoimidazolesuccinocarboxamide synthase [Actinomycetaceae bacterium]|nr:phosphoribosylaminoimidazolesuccinocarboxamide synthase [Actinomycetaceae bacterium]
MSEQIVNEEAYIGRKPIPGWNLIYSGKVHDLYVPASQRWHAGAQTLLIVATDRISIADRVVPSLIPGKGKILTELAEWWFKRLENIVQTHVVSTDVPPEVAGRAFIVRQLQMYPVECTVAGYMTASMMEQYKKTAAVNGISLPGGLREGDKLPFPIFLPARKGAVGQNDEDITFAQMEKIVGPGRARLLRQCAIDIYNYGHKVYYDAGIMLAAAKMEFGAPVDAGDEVVVLADEVLTPDCAVLWLAEDFRRGRKQTQMGKEYMRQWVENSGWDRDQGTPPPTLPQEIINTTYSRYRKVADRVINTLN